MVNPNFHSMGIRLYKKYGFSIESIKRQSIFVNEKFKDEIFMAKFII